MPLAPQAYVEAPAPSPPPNGLLRSAVVIDDAAMRWGEVVWAPESCGNATVFDPCAASEVTSLAANRPASRSFVPFVVDAYDTCSTFGFAAADYEGRARRALAARETKAVEAEWWEGDLFSANPHLAAPAATILGGGSAQSRRLAVALLTQAAADLNAGTGMIHVRAFLAALLFSDGLVRVGNDGKLYTGTGLLVVPGAGYTGTGPAGQAIGANTEWAYVTDPVEVHRGPVEVFANQLAETVDRGRNTVAVRAQRLYAIAWNGCALAAVNVDPTLF